MEEKLCTNCDKVKPVTDFNRAKGNKDGIRSSCKKCQAEYNREYVAANREQVSVRRRRYRDANRDLIVEQRKVHYLANREKIAERNREWNDANLDRVARYKQEWADTNRVRISDRRRQHRQDNLERYTARDRAYSEAHRGKIANRNREWKATARYGMTRDERDFLESMQLHRCAMCLEPLSGGRVDVDHDRSCCPDTGSCGRCVRGVIHHRCNNIVGVYEHGRKIRDPEWGELAAFYVEMTPQRMLPFFDRRATLAVDAGAA